MSKLNGYCAAADSPGIRLRQLLPDAQFLGPPDLCVRAVTADSRTCKPGDLFVATVGTHADGHDYLAEAIARGASAVVVERMLPVEIPQCVVDDARVALGQICQALAGHPSQRLKVVGVTGTNGKTTTTCLIASILQAAGYQPGLLGTLGYCDGLEVENGTHTTPPAPVLADRLARMAANGCTHAVMEVSSHALAQHRTAGMQFDAACFTNIRQDHLDYHGSLSAYRQAKRRLLGQLAPEGFAVFNADDPVCNSYLANFAGAALTIGLKEPAEITATLLERCSSEQTFLLQAGSDAAAVRTRMIGDHHISNCLMAAAVGLIYGIDLHDIIRGIEAIDHVPGRLERIECGQDFSAFVDYAHTPDALACTLQTLRNVTSGKLICVFGAGGDRDRHKRPMMGQVVEQLADTTIITTDNPRTEDPAAIVRDLLSATRRPEDFEVICDRRAAIRRALSLAEPGDCVVVAGKGHETYQVIGTKRHAIDDRQIVRDWLYQRSGETRTCRSAA